jgi:hypothetical protein
MKALTYEKREARQRRQRAVRQGWMEACRGEGGWTDSQSAIADSEARQPCRPADIIPASRIKSITYVIHVHGAPIAITPTGWHYTTWEAALHFDSEEEAAELAVRALGGKHAFNIYPHHQ